jgi:hypothetical protein
MNNSNVCSKEQVPDDLVVELEVVGAVVPLLADVEDLEVIAVAFLCRGKVKRE